MAETEELVTDADKKRTALVEENDALKAASASLVKTITALEQGVLALLPRLPEPVQARIKPLSQRIPLKLGTELTLADVSCANLDLDAVKRALAVQYNVDVALIDLSNPCAAASRRAAPPSLSVRAGARLHITAPSK